ncbi:Na+/H+ antiporter [Tunturibacter empetritectus]|uniref:Na+/H+ antiporter n=1 Tax=Tunturiibacter empetritectus TaxID=3069691 RepID=A0AAU7ZF45_9BACT
MMGGGVHAVQAVFLLLLVFVAVFAGLARRLKVPYPILLVIAGLLLSFLPGMPRIGLDPDLVFLVFLPPLLYSAAWTLSWREFQRNFVSIAMLAVGLVLFTIVGLAVVAGSLLPGFDWKSAVLLGAVVAATDAIAATSIARRVGLPQRIVDILEAESLVNDGTGLLALQFGLTMLVTGRTPSVIEGLGQLVFLTCGGVAVGLAIGAVVAWFERWVDDGPIEIVISILAPYGAYLLGARMQVSGVMAVIACSMYMSRKSPEYMSPQVRLQTTAVWDALTFILNGIVFVLIGLQLPYVVGQIVGMSRPVLLEYGIGFSALMICLRIAWVFAETYVAYGLRRWVRKLDVKPPQPRQVFVIGWGGMRGVLSLAAAISLPYALPGGRTFSQRSMIIYLAFCLIVATLVVQGLTLPWLIRIMGLSESGHTNREEQEARRVLATEAIMHLHRTRSKNRDQSPLFQELIDRYQQRLDAMPLERERSATGLIHQARRNDAILTALQAEREALIRLRDEEQIDDEVLRTLQRELDLAESRVHTGSMIHP